ncbi:GSCFA domain-containing protein [Synechococcus sp. PCC 7336]|uniref:GSCFA domain-containing protein n=1 Tax=Synechococcus sp. PCC 7336 TaxID=195250 RepID=UPI000344D009|nr:GSCFA domain-containing protein [Synechococcus sp. PCC 7336]
MSEQVIAKTNSTVVRSGHSKCDRWVKGNGSARERIETGVVIPEWAPSFQLAPDAKIFAMGSCFARNVEKALLQRQARVTSAEPESDILELRTNLLTGLLNKYNPISIHQELTWASSHTPFPEHGFIEYDGKYIDPSLRDRGRKGTLEFARARQAQLQQYFARSFEADLVIITLGLTETWFDRTTRIALAEAPSPRLFEQYPGRFACKILSYPECATVLSSIYSILQKYGNPNLKVVVTVSPVPLQRTFSGQDVIVANMMSKSTLRSAAGALAVASSGVDYFPSYEAAMVSNPSLVWMLDRRNVSDFIVDRIIGEFTRRYGL